MDGKALTFQDMILALEHYWADLGCTVMQPYDSEVGAGTFHTATLLRSLGPAPWRCCYPQPCRRPADGRYGENPNRMQHYYQFQVLVKPSPANSQELYLGSLAAIGLDPAAHDVRFVEDDWESPTLGAWGLGWEVWLDGMEVTQFTYFQQVGGIECDPVPVEITYGLERIAMYAQGVTSVYDLVWSVAPDGTPMTYGDVFLENEREFSAYNFEVADVEMMRQKFDDYERECQRCLDAKLPLPGYDCVLKCSHAFNLLDSRGALSATERAAYILRVRTLAKKSCEAYLAEVAARESDAVGDGGLAAGVGGGDAILGVGAPARAKDALTPNACGGTPAASAACCREQDAVAADPCHSERSAEGAESKNLSREPHDFLLEIGVEEMPSGPLMNAAAQLAKLAPAALDAAGLAHGEARVISGPRRLAVIVQGVAGATEAVHEELRGPAASIAFDEAGQPTKAALGFAKKNGVEADRLMRRCEADGREYVFAERNIEAKPALPLLSALAYTLIASLEWPNYRSQRWGAEHEGFVRPIRWICALFGAEVVPLSYADVTSSNTTRGHRVLAGGEHVVSEPAAYERVLRDAFVLGATERASAIRAGIAEVEERLGVRVDTPKRVFDEVVNLCEWPSVLTGRFDEEFLAVPPEIICESMLTNQRYFPCYDAQGKLTRSFVLVSNADPACAPVVIDGNERVVRARLDDAKFFYDEDLKVSLDEMRGRLASVGFHKRLGSVLDKSERIESLALAIAAEARLGAKLAAACARAAHLAKADLVSQAVIEFTSQQGVMGGYYALAAGEGDEVAEGIRDHYRPRFATDELPEGTCGCVVAVADKLDTIAGMFAIGEPPTGSKDPFALRRAAIGIVNILRERLPISPAPLIEAALAAYADQGIDFDAAATAAGVAGFIEGRMQQMARDEDIAADVVEAVSAGSLTAPADFFALARALQDARAHDAETFENLAVAFSRAAHLANPSLDGPADTTLMGSSEKELMDALGRAEDAVAAARAARDFDALIAQLAALRGPIDAFFADVMVMDEDTRLRENRLRLLNRAVTLIGDIANVGALAKRGA